MTCPAANSIAVSCEVRPRRNARTSGSTDFADFRRLNKSRVELVCGNLQKNQQEKTEKSVLVREPVSTKTRSIRMSFGMSAVEILAFELFGVPLDSQNDHAAFAAAR